MSAKNIEFESEFKLETRPQEQLLIEAVDGLSPARMLCISQGLAQLAATAASRFPAAAVHCHYLDLYHAEAAPAPLGEQAAKPYTRLLAGLPPQAVDLAALPLSAQGDAELTRELLQAAHQRLQAGGTLIASTDNPHDRWLHEEMGLLFGTVTRRESPQGTLYLGRKDRPLKRIRNFACEFVFRDRGRLIRAVSRPGVFSHRKVDPGARQLMAAMEIAAGDRVLDIGCGSGTVSLAAALCKEGVAVVAVDSHARAVECTALAPAAMALAMSRSNIVPVGRGPDKEHSTSSWQIRRITRAFASPGSSWKPGGRPCAMAAGSLW